MAKWKIILILLLFIIWGYCSIKSSMLFYITGSASKVEGYLSILIQCFIEIISIYYILTNLFLIHKCSLCKVIVMWSCFAFFITLINTKTLFNSLSDMMWWPLVFMLFYIISMKTKSDIFNRLVIKFFIPSIVITNVLIFVSLRSVSFIEGFDSSNQVFYIALILPLCFIYKEIKIRYLLLFIITFVVLISFKRSALIYAIIALTVAIYFDFLKRKHINPLYRLLLPIILVSVLCFIFNYVEDFTGGHVVGRLEAMQSDGGSGRMTIYKRMLDYYINESSVLSQMFGIGFDNAKFVYLKHYSQLLSTHNDILEMLIDFGFLGLILYLYVIIYLLKLLMRSKLLDNNYYQANIVAFMCFIVMTMVSHLFIYPTYYAYLNILWGMTAGKIQKQKNELNKFI